MPYEKPKLSMQQLGLPSKESANPIAEGNDGLRVLREHGNCDIPAESKKLNVVVQKVLDLEGEHQVAEVALGKGIFAGLRMAQHCNHNLHTRTVVKFESDEKLAALTATIKGCEMKAIELQQEMRSLAEEAQKALAERWHYSVKNFGLNPETNFYRINEDQNLIEEVELRCDKCTAGKEMIDAMEAVSEYIETLTEIKAEPTNDSE